ncbi:polyketide cyclase/dehydrase/lipid transport protein [Paraburkholderia eburnea]|uniref:Polyketide cyclase/dehydrase/lipid transport protein n=1 Tax=Paraburkholderia eburnea TaxID=1189126 RepID=A0A2S4LWS0_9BURK|nr:SRPBCC family protein [Paraburkholderia eburnea]POR46902.1 polyketide cyclase/dehydrase/lipid transport protein [Paraburkholderia eburnea]PRZ18005.1 polyketide cyclase/dehydrase/lipid transport protein [Paraburkholderia eburnea]
MASVNISVDMAAPVEWVWAKLGDFNGLPGWLEFIRSSRLSNGGRLRHLETIDGKLIVEERLEHNDAHRMYRYSIVDGPDPVTGYTATLCARQRDADSTTVTWSSRFEPLDAQNAAALVGHYEVLYRAGLDRLKVLVESQGSAR